MIKKVIIFKAKQLFAKHKEVQKIAFRPEGMYVDLIDSRRIFVKKEDVLKSISSQKEIIEMLKTFGLDINSIFESNMEIDRDIIFKKDAKKLQKEKHNQKQ